MAVSLFRQSNGFSSVSIQKIGKDARLKQRRHVQYALRELESIGVLQSIGLTRRGIRCYMVNKPAAPPVDKSDPLHGHSGHPQLDIKGTPEGHSGHPQLDIKGTLSRVFFRSFFQECYFKRSFHLRGAGKSGLRASANHKRFC